jgi:hypothetical protein
MRVEAVTTSPQGGAGRARELSSPTPTEPDGSDRALNALRAILARYDIGVIEDVRRLESLLRDLCPYDEGRVFVLTNAVRLGVVDRLLASRDPKLNDPLMASLDLRLQEQLGLTQDFAHWGVQCWATALGLWSHLPSAAIEDSVDSQRTVVSSRSGTTGPRWSSRVANYHRRTAPWPSINVQSVCQALHNYHLRTRPWT